jgi:hypothetical protein
METFSLNQTVSHVTNVTHPGVTTLCGGAPAAAEDPAAKILQLKVGLYKLNPVDP